MKHNLRIGLFGLGCVGKGLFDILNQTDHFDAEIVRICVKDQNKKRDIPLEYLTFDKEDILNDPDIDVVVELIDHADEAFEIVSAAISQGKDVVTANKKMLAEHLSELLDLQKRHRVSLLYEASACGSIPIIRSLEEYYDNEPIKRLEGIFNGSSNYILSKVINEGLAYDVALKQAQDLGFAESDPTLDVEGFDPKYKLCILALHGFGLVVDPKKVLNLGISKLSSSDLAFANDHGLKIKPIATAFKTPKSGLALFVMPQLVGADSSLFHVENEYNAVLVDTKFSQLQTLIGKGAGGHPTGAAVLSDISALSYEYKYAFKKKARNQLFYDVDANIRIYLRSKDLDLFDKINFEMIELDRRKEATPFVIATIRLSTLLNQKQVIDQSDAFVCYLDGDLKV